MIRKALKQFSMAIKSPRQAKRVIGSEIKIRLGIPTLRSVEFQVTHYCNLHCKFCYAEDIMYAEGRDKSMPLETFKRVIRECHDLGMIHVNVTGGEPLIRKDIIELVDSIPKDVVVSLVTNSSLLTQEKIDQLIGAGLSTIQMSYGSNYTGFKEELGRYCVRKGLSVTLSIVNVESERKNNEKAMKMAQEEGFNVLYNYPMRYNTTGLDSEFYWKHRKNPIVREDNMFWSGKNLCPAGTQKIYITNDGDIMPCDRIHKPYGNIYKNPVGDVWKDMQSRYQKHKTFCLLETDKAQWEENNRRSGKHYPLSLMPTESKNPFNVLENSPSDWKL